MFIAGFLALADHYGFTPKACRPHRPRTKGKTERMVGLADGGLYYIKHHFFQRRFSFRRKLATDSAHQEKVAHFAA